MERNPLCMLKMKRLICLILVCCLALSVLALPSAADRTRSFEFEETLAASLKALGLFRGVSDIDFALGTAPSRVQALIMMLRLMGLEQQALNDPGTHPFTDTEAYRWADPYIAYAYRNGLTKGVSGTEFGGLADAGLAVYLTFVLRALGYAEGEDGDFSWQNPLGLAQKVGLLSPQVRMTDFRRADVVLISYAALSAVRKGSNRTLAQELAERSVLDPAALAACYDPGAISRGALASPYAENTAARYQTERLPLGIDISGLPISYHGSVALIGDAAYELYGFYAAGVRAVAEQIAAGAAAVEGRSRVFGIIAPNRMGAVLSYSDAARLCRTEKTEAEGIAYAYEQMGDKVVTVDIATNLRMHGAEDIFFRTDHHWTALGSYYAYRAWAETAGFTPVGLDRFDLKVETGHLGMFYGYCGNPAAMRRNPDSIVAYIPRNSFSCSPADAMDFKAAGYNTFIGGDRGLTEIVNNDIADDSACVLVKDSYGNPFAVWLTQHYHTVYVIDYRHYRNTAGYLSFSQFAAEKGVQDFIVLLPITLSQSDATANYLAKYCR